MNTSPYKMTTKHTKDSRGELLSWRVDVIEGNDSLSTSITIDATSIKDTTFGYALVNLQDISAINLTKNNRFSIESTGNLMCTFAVRQRTWRNLIILKLIDHIENIGKSKIKNATTESIRRLLCPIVNRDTLSIQYIHFIPKTLSLHSGPPTR